ncbi:MAG: hypothetical protein CVV39_08465 [Planctomycetes bacterium HGW-Planctomycetes-1]|nr:MAG: hypothetical protein CVV39_08465 [Planctomycetes bacterium HGW-Planctomycetes-1]
MKKTLLVIFLIFIFSGESLSAARKKSSEDSKPSLSTVDGLIEYVRPLPAVRNVERWNNPYGEGLTIETQHYKIHTTLLEPLMLKQMPAFVEAAWRQYQSQIPVSVENHSGFVLYLFKDRAQWEQFTKGFTGNQWPVYLKIKKGAYFLKGACVAYNIGRSRTFSVIGHEGWHQFGDKYLKYRLPSWLDEGIAQLFEASDYENGQFVFKPAKNYSKLGALKLVMKDRKMIPLRNLIALNPGEVVLWEEADMGVMAFYAQAYALVRFLREDDYGKRLANYHQMLLGSLNGTWPIDETEAKIASDRNIPLTARWNSYIAQKLFDIYIGQNIEQIEPEYQRFCSKIVYHIRIK